MQDFNQVQAVRSALHKKFHGRQSIKSKITLHYKENIDREYGRAINAYYALLASTIQKYLEQIFNAPTLYNGKKTRINFDNAKDDFLAFIRKVFGRARDDFHSREQAFNLRDKVDRIGSITTRLSAKDWKRVVEKTLGINILDDYHSGEFYSEQLQLWIDENVGLISTLPDELLGDMQSIVENGFLNGRSNRDIVKDIQTQFGVSRNKAKFYATDQLSKLNADITHQQQTECGVEEYVWSSSRDQRVRERHAQLDGTKHRWDTPPIVDTKTGRRAHPGEDYRCRCVALPVFNIETIKLPWEIK